MARRPLEREQVYLDGGRRTTQLMRESLGGISMPYLCFPFLVQPLPDSSEHGRIIRRQVEVWLPQMPRAAAADEARAIIRKYGYEVLEEDKVEVCEKGERGLHPLLLAGIERNGFGFVFCWTDDA